MRLSLMLFMIFAAVAEAKPRGPVATLAPASEPGTRMLVTGQVFDPSGTKPVPGVIVYAYQTDATGVYNKTGDREPRLKGWVWGAKGKFAPIVTPRRAPDGLMHATINIRLK